MVEKKKDEKEKKTVKIKATAGAWWKSKTSEETEKTSGESVKEEKKEVKQTKPKRAPIARKTAASTTPRKTGRTSSKTKKVADTAEISPDNQTVEDIAGSAQPARKKAAPKAKTTKPRATRAKKATTPKKEVVESPSTDKSIVTEATAHQKAAAHADTTGSEKKAAKPRRGRPPKTVAKKVTAADVSKENFPESEDDSAGQKTAGTSEIAGKAESAKKGKSPKPQRGRRPKAAAKKQADGNKQIDSAQIAETTDPETISAPETADDGSERLGKEENTAEVSGAQETKETVSEQTQKPKPRRGRRPKATSKKDSTKEKQTPPETEEEDSNESRETSGEKGEDGIAQDQEAAKKSLSPKVEESKEELKKISKLLINAEEPEECRLALLEDGRLESINVSTIAKTQRKNNIYKARIVAIEPSLQAAFVEYGTDKNGFLPFSEIHPEYFKQELPAKIQHLVDSQQWKKLSITDVVERGQEILAQVVKEEVGKKGANMTTYLSIPGRCVVLMPGSDSAGISRKISGEQRRTQLRDTMKSMDIPEGIGWIVRTASVDITEEDLTRDVGFLLKLWEDIKGKGQKLEGVGLVYEEQDSVLRFLREHFDPSIQEILVDDREALEQVKDFVQMLPKDQQSVTVRLHQGARPIFNQFSVEDQIESIYQPQVSLPSGGSIVIDPTEALVAIDVNSGSTSKGKNFEASIFQANMEAAAELARQLRLRDLGGLIVVDFIDMRSRKNILAVEKQVRAAMKKDKAKVDFSRISKFGLMQISRQKLGAPIEAGNYRRCEHCKGRGTVRSVETLSLFYLRRIQTGASRKPVEKIDCHFPLDVSAYLLNQKRTEINEMEKRYNVEIIIHAETRMKPSENEIIFHKAEKDTNNKKQA